LVNVGNQGREFAMIPKRERAVEDQDTAKAKYARFAGPILGVMVLIVALYSYGIVFLATVVSGGKWGAAVLVFALASYALRMIPRRGTLQATEDQGTVKARQRWLPDWCLAGFLIISSLAFNWACAFLWFSRQYALFSGPVLGVTGLIVALYAAIAFLATRRFGGTWLTAVAVFALASCALSGNVAWWLDLHR
jgi:hypothetical protein